MLFAPGVVSGVASQDGPSFTGDGDEFYFFRWDGGGANYLVMTRRDGVWTEPSAVPFSKEFDFAKASISPDGHSLVFCTSRGTSEREGREDYDLWLMERSEGTWIEPTRLGPEVNTEAIECCPVLSPSGDLYFHRDPSEGRGCEILVSTDNEGRRAEVENLGPLVNSELQEVDPTIAPDESYLVFCVRDREGGFGNNDLHVSFRDHEGAWSRPVNLGPGINSPQEELTPHVTPDGRYLLFSSNRSGVYEIYWVSTESIRSLWSGR